MWIFFSKRMYNHFFFEPTLTRAERLMKFLLSSSYSRQAFLFDMQENPFGGLWFYMSLLCAYGLWNNLYSRSLHTWKDYAGIICIRKEPGFERIYK